MQHPNIIAGPATHMHKVIRFLSAVKKIHRLQPVDATHREPVIVTSCYVKPGILHCASVVDFSSYVSRPFNHIDMFNPWLHVLRVHSKYLGWPSTWQAVNASYLCIIDHLCSIAVDEPPLVQICPRDCQCLTADFIWFGMYHWSRSSRLI